MNLKKVSINKEIFRLAIPNILTNLSVPLLSTVDTALMGQLSTTHLGAVGIGSMLFNFLYWNFGFLRMGTTGMTAQAFGAKQELELPRVLSRALILAVVLALMLLVFQHYIESAGIRLLQVSSVGEPLVRTYFDIRIWAAPASLMLYALFGFYFGMQNAIYPLILTIIINVANIGLSAWFILGLGMDVEGVAYGTVIAQYVGLLAAIILLANKYKDVWKQLSMKVINDIVAFKGFLRVNSDIFIRTLCLTFVFGFFSAESSGQGELILAANVILLQLLNWMSYGVDGFAYASESLVGRYKGAQEQQTVTKVIRQSFVYGMGLAILFSMVYAVAGQPIIQLFTDDPATITMTMKYLKWMVILPIIGTPSYIWDGIFVGLTASRAMRNSMLISLGVFLATYFSFEEKWANDGLWLALLVFLASRSIIQWWLYKQKGWALK